MLLGSRRPGDDIVCLMMAMTMIRKHSLVRPILGLA
jgi:hypothetical protein